mmetsp:Transcript_64382/g.145216  ORF Transcript_64382/g.145216 Transcript_64382/m.145216 type:complete len:234 (+) Transcript_64382:625-1326(+)
MVSRQAPSTVAKSAAHHGAAAGSAATTGQTEATKGLVADSQAPGAPSASAPSAKVRSEGMRATAAPLPSLFSALWAENWATSWSQALEARVPTMSNASCPAALDALLDASAAAAALPPPPSSSVGPEPEHRSASSFSPKPMSPKTASAKRASGAEARRASRARAALPPSESHEPTNPIFLNNSDFSALATASAWFAPPTAASTTCENAAAVRASLRWTLMASITAPMAMAGRP